MELDLYINKQMDFDFCYDFNTNKLKLCGIDEYIDLYLQENISATKNPNNDFISLFNNELSSIKETKKMHIESEIEIPSVGSRYLIVKGIYDEINNQVRGKIYDDTSNKIFKQKTLQTEKLKSLGALAGGIAHDFNNQLMVILGSCELLSKHITNPDAKHHLSNIEESARSSAELINKLLTFSHPDRIPKLAFNLLNAVDDTITIINRTSTNKVSVLYDCFLDEVMIYGNYGLIQNAILNICTNSIESFNKEGIIRIKPFISKIKNVPNDIFNKSDFKEGVYAQIEISDNGCGIKEDIKDKIFDPFFTTKCFDKGTGLGLSTVLGTVESHNGLIGVKSTEGKGTTITLYFKLTKGAEVMFLQEKKKKKQVLVIDDENLVRMILNDMLTDLGYDVISFGNGFSALEYYKLNKDNISLIICDMMMPQMTGKDVFYKVKEINEEQKFVILSGYSKEEDINLIGKLDAYLTKPISSISLGKIIEKVLK
ncbi:MAG: ATP-binding protein [bacterium]